MNKLTIEYLPLEDLKPYANNAKIHTEEQIQQIRKSIEEFGMNDPIAIWKDNEIIEGHGRLLACQQMGMKEVPVIRLDDLTDEQRRAYMNVHNNLTMNTGFDVNVLSEELGKIESIDMAQFGFDLSFFEDPKEVKDDDYDIDQHVETKVKEKEIWVLGVHRLMCGDGTNADDIRKLIGGGSVNLLLTDPPYNIDYTGKTQDALKIQNDNMKDSEFRAFLVSSFEAAKSVMEPGAAFYIWHADSEGYNFRGACRDVGWQVRECLIWSKNTFTLGRQDYQWQHEPCLYGWNDGTHSWYSDRKQSTVLEFDRPQRSAEHPTMKPVPLFAYLIQNSTEENEVVLDMFGGSGTTLIACEQLGRKCRMMELDPHYCDVIINRWETLTGKKAVRLCD